MLVRCMAGSEQLILVGRERSVPEPFLRRPGGRVTRVAYHALLAAVPVPFRISCRQLTP